MTMKTKNLISIFLVLSFLLFASAVYAEDLTYSKSVAAVCDEFESQIQSSVDRESYLEAISAAAEYEQALLSRYPASTFEMGLFQCEAHHITFQSPFEGWTQQNLKEMGLDEWLPTMGIDVLITLKGEVEDDKFVLFSMEFGKLMQRIGGDEFANVDLSDQDLVSAAQMMASNLGTVENQEFRSMGDHRILVLDIATPILGPSVIMANLAHNRCIYCFLLTSSAGNYTENENRLYELIKTVDFNYRPPDQTKIESIRQKLTSKADISQVLGCVRELALAGEYGAAGDELSLIRSLIAQRMPPPVVEGDLARYSLYGITLRNPDPEKWNLSVNTQGAIGMLILEDRFSVNSSGIAVGVINKVLSYGPHAEKLTGENDQEEENKSFLSSVGRGGLLSIGGEIESERFRMFKGSFAYEGVASPNVPRTKLKIIVFQQPSCFVMVLMFMETLNFEAQAEEYETLVDRYLQVAAR
jgi:hypothetical protein